MTVSPDPYSSHLLLHTKPKIIDINSYFSVNSFHASLLISVNVNHDQDVIIVFYIEKK